MYLISVFTDWLWNQSLLETSGVITGILCVYLAAKNNIWSWPIAIISVLIYIFIFFEAKLYADTGLQVYFLLMNFYGWYFWSRKDEQRKVPVSLISF
jgi:nicotinamide mononucleotide transporter